MFLLEYSLVCHAHSKLLVIDNAFRFPVLLAFISDRFAMRGPCILVMLPVGIVGQSNLLPSHVYYVESMVQVLSLPSLLKQME